MRTRLVIVCCAALAFSFNAHLSLADETNITDGTSVFIWNPDTGTLVLGSPSGFDDDYAAGESMWLRYRQPDDFGGNNIVTHSTADFTNGTDTVDNSATSSGDTGTQHVEYFFSNGFNTIQILNIDISYSISTGVFGNPRLIQTTVVSNVSADPITDIQLFNYYDWDLSTVGGAFNNQNRGVDYSIDAFTGFLQTNPVFGGPPPHSDAFRGTDDFDQWQVSIFGTIETQISNGNNLNNSGTPFGFGDADGDDMEAAFGWTIGTLDVGESFTVTQYIATIPEPGSLAVIGILFAGALLGRRRRH